MAINAEEARDIPLEASSFKADGSTNPRYFRADHAQTQAWEWPLLMILQADPLSDTTVDLPRIYHAITSVSPDCRVMQQISVRSKAGSAPPADNASRLTSTDRSYKSLLYTWAARPDTSQILELVEYPNVFRYFKVWSEMNESAAETRADD